MKGLAFGSLVLAMLSLTACDRSADLARETCACPESGGAVVDATLLAFLSKARAVHHQADLAEAAGDRARATEVLAELTTGLSPAYTAEVREVLADTRARLGDLRSQEGAFDAAEADVAAGLLLATETTHFRGHLFEMRGLIEQRRSKALADAGDGAGADQAKARAIAAFGQAIDVQDEVIRGALRGVGEGADKR